MPTPPSYSICGSGGGGEGVGRGGGGAGTKIGLRLLMKKDTGGMTKEIKSKTNKDLEPQLFYVIHFCLSHSFSLKGLSNLHPTNNRL